MAGNEVVGLLAVDDWGGRETLSLRNGMKMGLRWWRGVLMRKQTKRYLDDRQARKYWFVSFGKTR